MKSFFNFLEKTKMTPNDLYALYSIYIGVGVHKFINYEESYQKLFDNQYITKNVFGHYELTPLGKSYLAVVGEYFKEKLIDRVDYKENVLKYNSLFPKGKRKDSSTGYRANPKELEQVFRWFFATYPEYSWDDVLTVTEKYIQSFNGDYTYLKNAKYFVKKTDKNNIVTSMLANLIYNYKENSDVFDSGTFYYGET